MAEEKEAKWITGFWRRIGAFIIDSIVLGSVGLFMGMFLETYLIEAGVWGRLLGFMIALAYFGVLNSGIANGQTLGKKVLKIQVVNKNNNLISIPKSFCRYSIIGIPFFLNGAQFPPEVMSSFWIYVISFILFGGLFAIIYLYIFNRITRQSLHDLACNTYVVNAEVQKTDIGTLWRPHIAVVVLLFIIAALAPVFTANLSQQEPFVDLVHSSEALMQNEAVKYVSVSQGQSTFTSAKNETTETKYVSAQVFLKNNEISNIELAKSLAQLLANAYPKALEKDVIAIVLIYGYDIGIASKWSNYTHQFDPSNLIK